MLKCIVKGDSEEANTGRSNFGIQGRRTRQRLPEETRLNGEIPESTLKVSYGDTTFIGIFFFFLVDCFIFGILLFLISFSLELKLLIYVYMEFLFLI